MSCVHLQAKPLTFDSIGFKLVLFVKLKVVIMYFVQLLLNLCKSQHEYIVHVMGLWLNWDHCDLCSLCLLHQMSREVFI